MTLALRQVGWGVSAFLASPAQRRQAVECVRRGASLLDGDLGRGSWEDRLDMKALSVNNVNRCVLAQLYGGFGRGWLRLLGGNFFDDYDHYGFFSRRESLTHWAWSQELKTRRAEAVAPAQELAPVLR